MCVAYPSALRCCGSVVTLMGSASGTASSITRCCSPTCAGYRPLISDVRVGVQIAFTYAFCRTTPSLASRDRVGVRTLLPVPVKGTSVKPKSSATTSTTCGCATAPRSSAADGRARPAAGQGPALAGGVPGCSGSPPAVPLGASAAAACA